MNRFYQISKVEKINIINKASENLGLPPAAVEKDWWVTLILKTVFEMEIGKYLIFKGGTSLSKAWQIIERFSEDIDFVLDRTYLGFTEEFQSNNNLSKLRKVSNEKLSTEFFNDLKTSLIEQGYNDLKMKVDALPDDPTTIYIEYESLVEKVNYIEPIVKLEIGVRSLKEPSSLKAIHSFIGGQFPEAAFADTHFDVPCVNPERTLLEKLFLLHEEFKKPIDKIRVERLSRHLYDIEKIHLNGYSKIAFDNHELIRTIIDHRQKFTRISKIDYTKHFPGVLSPIPPKSFLNRWKKDYQTMQNEMIQGESLDFDKLLEEIKKIAQTYNAIKMED